MKLNKFIAQLLSAGILFNNIYFYSNANTLYTEIPNRYETLEDNYITIDDSTEEGLHEIEIFGNTIQDENNLEDIQSVGDLYVDKDGNPILDSKGREQYKVILNSKSKSLIDLKQYYESEMIIIEGKNILECNDSNKIRYIDIEFKPDTQYTVSFDFMRKDTYGILTVLFKYSDGTTSYGARNHLDGWQSHSVTSTKNKSVVSARIYNASNGGHTGYLDLDTFMIEEGVNSTSYTKSEFHEATILLPTQLQKVGNVADRLYWDDKNHKYIIEKNISRILIDDTTDINMYPDNTVNTRGFFIHNTNIKHSGINNFFKTVSDVAPGAVFTMEEEGISYNYGYIKVSILKNRLSECTLEGIKEFLRLNPIVIYINLEDTNYIETNITSKLKIPTYDDKTHINIKTENGVNPTLKVTVDRLPSIARNAVKKAEANSSADNISLARMYINILPESTFKDQLQERLSEVFNSDITLDRKSATANLDIYIKNENILSLSLNTNNVTFENYSGVEDMEMPNAINISINSSLPYSLNAYIPSEIQNSDKSETMPIDMFNIKEGSETNYKQFTNTTDRIILKDNCDSGNNNIHNIDLKLASNQAYKPDVYKTTIKFEAVQK